MSNHQEIERESTYQSDSHILWDMLSMCFDGCFANASSYERVSNTLDQHVFKTVSTLYSQLAERLLKGLGKLPKDTGSMNQDSGHVSIAYLSALNGSDKTLSNRMMSVNWQVIKRIGKLVRKLKNRLFANRIIDYLARIQVVLDNTENRRKAAKLTK
jgi:hypothetical protein